MYPSSRSRRWSHRSGRPLFLWLSALIALLLVVGGGSVRAAPAGIEVLEERFDYAFAEALTFSLRARSEEPITRAVLFYQLEGSPLRRRIYPQMTAGTSLHLNHREDLEPGQFAPGTVLHAWWRLETASGDVFETAPRSLRYDDDRFAWQVTQGEYLDVYWYGTDAARAAKILAWAEEALARIEEDFSVSLEQRVRVYAYNSQRDMRAALSSRSEGFDELVVTLGVVVADDTLLLLATHRDAELTIAHELTHIVVGQVTRNPYIGIPRWLDEGLAMYAEGEERFGARALERAIANDTVLSLRSMSAYTGRAEEVDLFYAQARSVVAYMLETYGREKMRELLETFSEGMLQDEALMRVYGMDLEALEDAWRESVGLGPRQRRAPRPTPVPASRALPLPVPVG